MGKRSHKKGSGVVRALRRKLRRLKNEELRKTFKRERGLTMPHDRYEVYYDEFERRGEAIPE